MTSASHENEEQQAHADPVSKTDAPTQGFIDTLKRRHASPSSTQREADIEQAEAEGEWTPTETLSKGSESQSKPRDSSGINPQGVIDESMRYMPRA